MSRALNAWVLPRAMSLLGSSTRQVNVYGRRGRTRVVPRDVENDIDFEAPPTPKPASRGLFSGFDFRAWMDSPRKVWNQLTPRKQPAQTHSDLTGSPPSDKVYTTPTRRVPFAPRDNARAPSPELPTAELEKLSLTDDALTQLLRVVQQDAPCSFSACVDDLVGKGSITKVGEASYSEVYRIVRPLQGAKGRPAISVVKVLPVGGDSNDRGPAQSPMASVAREIQLTLALSPRADAPGHFVRLQEAHIVQGAYPATLLAEWDAFKTRDTRSENARPDSLPDTQLYALLCMDDAGTELEHTPLASWAHRAAVFWQTAYAIAHAEASSEFEHRDLHLGNILVTQAPVRRATRSASGQDDMPEGQLPASLWQTYAPRPSGIRATIIDYSLSRMIVDGAVLAYDFRDASLFEGQGDTQYDVYRIMRTLVAGDWTTYHPCTNLLWLRFVAQRLLAADEPPEQAGTSEDAAYTSLLLAEQLAEDAVEHLRRAAPQRSVSTRSKRRSIQRGPDAWKMPRDLRPPTIRSAAELVHATTQALAHPR